MKIYIRNRLISRAAIALLAVCMGMMTMFQPNSAFASGGLSIDMPWYKVPISGATNLYGIVSDSQSNLFVANVSGIYKLAAGESEWQANSYALTAANSVAIAIDNDDQLYYASNHFVYRLNDNNTSEAVTNHIFGSISGIAVDGSGNLYVADTYAGVFKLVDGSWINLNGVVSDDGISFLAADGYGNLWIATQSSSVYKLPAGTSSWVDFTPSGGFAYVAGLSTDSSGNVYVTDQGFNRVYERIYGSVGWVEITSAGEFSNVAGVAADPNGHVYTLNEIGITYYLEQTTPLVVFTGIELDSTSYSLEVNETHQSMTSAVYTDDSTVPFDSEAGVEYASSDTDVATVDAISGLVTAVAPGTATITASYEDKQATATVTVTAPSATLTGIELDSGSYSLQVNGTHQSVVTAVYSDDSAVQIDSGVTYESSNSNVAVVDAGGLVTANAAGESTITATYGGKMASATVTVTSADNGGETTPSVPAAPNDGVDVLVNGKVENIGSAATTTDGGRTITTISIDPQKLADRLAAEGQGAVVTIPANANSDVFIGELNGAMIKNMEDQQAILAIRTNTATYTIPAGQINIGAVSNRLGTSVALQDIQVRIGIANPTADTAQLARNAAAEGQFTIVAQPLEFTVTGTYGGQMVEVTDFNAYVERDVAIPDGVDPSKITTGIVIDPDGTVRHVPTKVVNVDGTYYAQINSLTNSTYSVVWHPIEFSDVANHWAKDAVNDIGSRMVVDGTGDGLFSPDQDITRAQFAAIVVRGLGLKPASGASSFSDVSENAWYDAAVQTAYAYGLVNGFEDGSFRPDGKITREEAMTIMAKAMKITGLQPAVPAAADATLQTFADGAAAAEWAQAGIADCVQAGVVTGESADKLAPKDNMTRAEVAAIMERLLQKSDLIN